MWAMEVLVWRNGKNVWKAVRPEGGDPYLYDDKERAAKMLRICYRDSVREARLGGEQTVRITEVTTNEAGALVRVFDGTEIL